MATDETELTFIRCPNCRSLVPAVATRCRMCGQLIEQGAEPPSSGGIDASGKRPRVRQRTMSVSDSDVASAKEGVDFTAPERNVPEEQHRVHQGSSIHEREPEPAAPASTEWETEPLSARSHETPESDGGHDLHEEDDFDGEGGEEDVENGSEESAPSFGGPEGMPGERRKRRRRRRRKKRGGGESFGGGEHQSWQEPRNDQHHRDPEPVQPPRPTPSHEEHHAAPRSASGSGSHLNWQQQEKPMFGSSLGGEERNRETGFRAEQSAGTEQDGVLIGWFVDFGKDPRGSAREIRSGRFFLSGEQLRPTDLVLKHESLSTPHCMMRASSQGGVQLQDLMSEQGTSLRRAGESNFQRMNEPFTVENGDTVRFGSYELLVCLVSGKRRNR